MKSTLLRSHLTAGIAGLVFALFCGLVSVALLPFPFFVIFFAPLWGFAFYIIPTFLGIVLARGLAKRLGPYDLFSLLAGVLALALSFGFDYASSIRSWLSSHGEIHGTILGPGPPPEDIGGWIARAASLAVWIGLMLGTGIAWKRAREAKAPDATLTQAETSKIYFWLCLDSVVIGSLTFAILCADLNQRREWSSPEKVLARTEGVLQDKDASAGDRALALNTIEHLRDQTGTLDILRRAVREETGETQMSAAASLIGKDDMLALSVLEGPLMDGAVITGTVLPTTSRTVSEGNGVQTTGFGHIGPMNFGSSLAGVKDPSSAPILVRLMKSPNAEARRGAASALRHLMTLRERGMNHWVPTWPNTVDVPAVTDAMIAGIDDSDGLVRYFSVCTLMEINDNPHYPATRIFQENEQDYLDTWHAWAKEHTAAPH